MRKKNFETFRNHVVFAANIDVSTCRSHSNIRRSRAQMFVAYPKGPQHIQPQSIILN